MIDALDRQMAPIDRQLGALARRRPGARALQGHYGNGPLISVVILAELGDRAGSPPRARRFATPIAPHRLGAAAAEFAEKGSESESGQSPLLRRKESQRGRGEQTARVTCGRGGHSPWEKPSGISPAPASSHFRPGIRSFHATFSSSSASKSGFSSRSDASCLPGIRARATSPVGASKPKKNLAVGLLVHSLSDFGLVEVPPALWALLRCSHAIKRTGQAGPCEGLAPLAVEKRDPENGGADAST